MLLASHSLHIRETFIVANKVTIFSNQESFLPLLTPPFELAAIHSDPQKSRNMIVWEE